jgi:aromatic ring-cleaving dioxygenase
MSEIKRPVNSHDAYHAHIYYDAQTFDQAQILVEKSNRELGLQTGYMHRQLVGPHPCWSCQVNFSSEEFDQYIEWLESHRDGLTILIHALSGDVIKDHTDFAYWLGDSVELNIGFLEEYLAKMQLQ